MGKRYVILAAIATFVALSCLIVFFIIYSASTVTCTSRECVQSASELLTHIDSTVPPCNDFYEFTCGNFLKTLDENDSKRLTDYMGSVKSNQLRQMVEEPWGSQDAPAMQKTKIIYGACINETAINEVGLGPVRAILRDIGGWPILARGDWRENDFDWKNATHRLRAHGVNFNAFIRVNVGNDKSEPTKHIITISEGARVDSIQNDTNAYLEYMTGIAAYFGADKNRALEDSNEVIQFQSFLKRALDGSKHGNLYAPKTISQLQYDFPSIPWVDYINGILYPSATVTSDEVVNISNPEYIRSFLNLLYRTPKRILANYISWYLIQELIPYLPEYLREFKEEYKSKVSNYKRKSRRDSCLKIIENKMPLAIEAAYVKNFISDDTKRITKDIIDYIKKEYNKILDDIDWLDRDAKEVAREKLASTKDYIAHTPDDTRKTEQIYDQVEVKPNDFLASMIEIELFNLNLKYRRLEAPVYEDDGDKLLYSIKENTLVLPSQYLQGLFFNEHRPQYMNYGAIGTIIAYQLSKLFLEGRHYDLYGNLREWSTSQSLYNYYNRTKCISEQYKEFYIPGLGRNVNASVTQEDDIATFFGKKVAYEAYRTWSENHDTEQRLPGLGYTPKQLFWISSAMYECSQSTQDEIAAEIFLGHRSIGRYRVMGPLRNLEDFARDFSCPSAAYMNPHSKCLLF